MFQLSLKKTFRAALMVDNACQVSTKKYHHKVDKTDVQILVEIITKHNLRGKQ